MAVPTSFTDLSTTPASNSPSGSENVFPNLDDYLRFTSAAIASIYANTATNGWVSPYLATSWAASPTAIGGTTPSSAAFTTLSASSTVSGAGFTAYLASPPAIGGTTPAAGTFTAGTFSTSLRMVGAVALGYDTGSGGTVTQATDKSTAVTLNKPVGRITMNNATLASVTRVSFTLNNSLITASDVIYVSISGAFTGYDIQARVQAAGSATITVYNNTVSPLSEFLVLNFVVIKGATA